MGGYYRFTTQAYVSALSFALQAWRQLNENLPIGCILDLPGFLEFVVAILWRLKIIYSYIMNQGFFVTIFIMDSFIDITSDLDGVTLELLSLWRMDWKFNITPDPIIPEECNCSWSLSFNTSKKRESY